MKQERLRCVDESGTKRRRGTLEASLHLSLLCWHGMTWRKAKQDGLTTVPPMANSTHAGAR